MEDTRRAIRQGRAMAAEGLFERAKIIWKATLSAAYSLQDYAGMFVLSVNIGEACLQIAMQSNTTSRALSQLQEAKENLEYAVQLVENCFLWNIVTGYRDLYQGVQRAKTLRRRAKKLLDKLQQCELQQPTISGKNVVEICTTCRLEDGDILLDENDACTYCRECYEEHYATVGKDASIQTAEELVAVQAVDGLGEGKRCGLNANLRLDEKKGDAIRVHIEDKYAGEIDTESSEKAELNRTRYERVELGSLAEFLSGTLQIGCTVEQPQIQQNNFQNDALILVAEEEECSGEPIAISCDLQEVSPATSGKSVLHEEEMPLVDEVTDDAHKKCEYSIARLLELWKLSPCDCPEPLLASPVRDDGSAPTPARNKVNNSRKKMNSAKTISASSGASYQQNNTHITGSNQVKALEERDVALSVSPLPTMDFCNTLRKALQTERRAAFVSIDTI